MKLNKERIVLRKLEGKRHYLGRYDICFNYDQDRMFKRFHDFGQVAPDIKRAVLDNGLTPHGFMGWKDRTHE